MIKNASNISYTCILYQLLSDCIKMLFHGRYSLHLQSDYLIINQGQLICRICKHILLNNVNKDANPLSLRILVSNIRTFSENNNNFCQN